MPARSRSLPPLCLLALLGCGGGAPEQTRQQVDFRHAGAEVGPAAVRWQGDGLSQAELQRRLEEMSPALRARYTTPEARREWALSLARFELLAREALARGYANDPEAVEAAKRVMVQRLVRERLEEAPAEVSEAELAAHYEKVRGDYVQPEAVRLSHVFLAVPRGAAPAQVARVRERAQALAAEARALPTGDAAAFGRLAREHSEEPRTQPLDGDLRFQTLEALAQGYGAPVAAAARALAQGEVAGPVQTEGGFHVLKLTGRRAALSLGLADVREALVGRLAADKRQAAYATFLAQLEQRYGLQVDARALEALHVDLQALMRAAQAPLPGSVPAPAQGPGSVPTGSSR